MKPKTVQIGKEQSIYSIVEAGAPTIDDECQLAGKGEGVDYLGSKVANSE